MPTYRLDLEYDGTRYRGWQEQRNARTVAGTLRRAIEAAGVSVEELGGSGRTDAGVHALQQVAHLRIPQPVAPESLRAKVNETLPADVHVTAIARAAERFHARHDAVRRSYLYQISTRRTAFAKRWVWWVRDPLDAAAMARAASLMTGRHDFSRFCERPGEQSSTIVVVEDARIVRDDGLVLVRLTASHFLWRMVRRLVGTLVEVGTGRLAADRVGALLSATGDERPAEWTAPSAGLFLERVGYPGDPPPADPSPAVPVRDVVPRAPRFVGAGRRGR